MKLTHIAAQQNTPVPSHDRPSDEVPTTRRGGPRRGGPRRSLGRDIAHERRPPITERQENEAVRPWMVVYVVTLAVLCIPTVVLPIITAILTVMVSMSG